MPEEEQGTPTSPDPGLGSAPWASDLENLIADPESRAAVDEYLRTNWQPRMTQLEQQAAQSTDAQNLWDNLSENPGDTVVAIIDQMFDPESAARVYSALSGEQGQEAQQAAQEAVTEAVEQSSSQASLDPHTQELLQAFEAKQHEEAYWSELDQHIDANHDLDATLLRKHVHSFVAAADGDIAEGVARYRAFLNEFGTPATDAEIENNAPEVLTAEGSATNGAPVTTKQGWDEAFQDFESEVKASNQRPAPPVGVA